MKKRCAIIFLILMFFSFNISANAKVDESLIYKSIEEKICDIKESGLKIKIETTEPTEKIINKIKKSETIKDVTNDENLSNYLYTNSNNNKNIIEIEIKKNNLNIEKIKKEFQYLLDDKNTKVQYFSYIKGKLSSDKETLSYKNQLISILSNLGIKNEKTLEIANGTTGIIEFKNNIKINYGIIRYDTGTYLIIGTPVIFTTY